ncbi:GTP cyclohydrolase 1 feedback regulatory-like protein [Achlya hypogyna]|uniref:GTP cyclohydrolase 1 feedback regulatory protein n=1 Tax=Achlya hypogyna TaxID=1202772 RepID=A0A1V9YCH4_ACHHY|nr:GTP cyclohydrolase 1 feedback regulatory-like protein [Achlya hypogyna]
MFLLVSTEVTVTTGPTIVGDETSDADLMKTLGARLVQAKCQTYKHYAVAAPPRAVLDQLERLGFELKGMSGLGQSLVWTLHKGS